MGSKEERPSIDIDDAELVDLWALIGGRQRERGRSWGRRRCIFVHKLLFHFFIHIIWDTIAR